MSTGPKQGWGGKRTGAGRPWGAKNKKATVAQVRAMFRALPYANDQELQQLIDSLMGHVYGDTAPVRAKLAIVDKFFRLEAAASRHG